MLGWALLVWATCRRRPLTFKLSPAGESHRSALPRGDISSKRPAHKNIQPALRVWINVLLREHLSRWARRDAHCCRPGGATARPLCACVPSATKKWIPGSRTVSRTAFAVAASRALFSWGETKTRSAARARTVPGVVVSWLSAVQCCLWDVRPRAGWSSALLAAAAWRAAPPAPAPLPTLTHHERPAGHLRVLRWTLQVLQCWPLPERVSRRNLVFTLLTRDWIVIKLYF